jgi:hypothetical protein
MTAHAIPAQARPPSRGFRELVKVEEKRALRAPVGPLLGVLVPVILLVIFSAIPGLKQPAPGSTLTMFTQYVPVLIGMSVCLIGLVSLPIPVVSDRQAGVLRRFATTPRAGLRGMVVVTVPACPPGTPRESADRPRNVRPGRRPSAPGPRRTRESPDHRSAS